MKKKLFISYAHEDYEVLQAFEEHLETLRRNKKFDFLDCFIDQSKIKAGYYWDTTIEEALESADGYVFFLSRHAMQSKYIREKELPCMAARYKPDECPIYVFRVSPCFYDEEIQARDSKASIRLDRLQDVGPNLHGEQKWYHDLELRQTEGALVAAVETIWKGMFELRDQTGGDQDVSLAGDTPVSRVNWGKTPKKICKPKLENYLAFLDRSEVVAPLEAEVTTNIMVALAATGTDVDWLDGLSKRLCFDHIPGVTTDESAGRNGKTPEYDSAKIPWPAAKKEEPLNMRERQLWTPLFHKWGVTSTADLDRDLDALWSRLKRQLNGDRRVVVHYFVKTKGSDLKKDQELARRLALKWKHFFDGQVDRQLSGRLLLLFSICDNSGENQSWWPWSKKPLTEEQLIQTMREVLNQSVDNLDRGQGCCALKGGRLSKIELTDIEDSNWRDSIKATGFEQDIIDTFFDTMDKQVPREGIGLGDLLRALKQDPEIKRRFDTN